MSERRGRVQELKLLGVSERMACRMVGLARSSVRYPLQPSSLGEGELRGAVRRLARQHRRDGYRRITALLQRPGHRVDAKRVWRIWKSEGLSLPRKRPRRRRQRPGAGLPPLALKPNQVWTYDCLFDRTEAGQILKILSVLDQRTRERLAIRVESHLGAGKVIETLEWLLMQRGAPEYLERQRPRVHRTSVARLARRCCQGDAHGGHRARASVAERVRGELHREVSR